MCFLRLNISIYVFGVSFSNIIILGLLIVSSQPNPANYYLLIRIFLLFMKLLASRIRKVFALRGESVQLDEMDRHCGDEDRFNWGPKGACG